MLHFIYEQKKGLFARLGSSGAVAELQSSSLRFQLLIAPGMKNPRPESGV